jgi:curved DNA-binding protein CbpA
MTEAPSQLEGKGPYEILGVPKDATIEVIRRSYRRLALAVHPDRNPSPSAQRDFQLLAGAMETLGDADKRARYDAGEGGEDNEPVDVDLMSAARDLYRRVTEQDIIAFEEKYIGSAEERADICAAMSKYPGNMKSVIDSVPFARAVDAPRFQKIFASYKEGKTTQDTKTTSAGALIPVVEGQISVLSMREREKQRHLAMVAEMEERYSSRDQSFVEPDDNAFNEIQRRLDANRENRRAARSRTSTAPRPREPERELDENEKENESAPSRSRPPRAKRSRRSFDS